jgi:hypothetical protein
MDLDQFLALNGFADPTTRDKRKKINGWYRRWKRARYRRFGGARFSGGICGDGV